MAIPTYQQQPLPVSSVLPANTVLNVTCSFSLGTKVDLNSLKSKMKGAEIKQSPSSGKALTMCLELTSTVALVTPSGRVIVTEAGSVEQARDAAVKYVNLIFKVNPSVKFEEFYVQSIVATVQLKHQVWLEKLDYTHWQHTLYEPCVYPGLVYTLPQSQRGRLMEAIVFLSGRMVLRGALSMTELERMYLQMVALLEDFRPRAT